MRERLSETEIQVKAYLLLDRALLILAVFDNLAGRALIYRPREIQSCRNHLSPSLMARRSAERDGSIADRHRAINPLAFQISRIGATEGECRVITRIGS